MSAADLGNVSEQIKSGQGVTFDPASVQQLVEGIQIVEKDRLLGVSKLAWFIYGGVVVLGVMLGLVLMAVDYLVHG